MSDTAVRVENISKLYQLGEISTGTLARDLSRWWAGVRGRDDPYQKVGQANDRTTRGASDFVWALQDVSFEVKQGEILGIIGRNGAGKSTLLKILSRVTKPTTGRIRIKGRMASLLEVGTGFHPELTGRENIFLNGAILGMRKAEVRARFDEIVDFAGVERYIDTPVKRYSSGMYVRLAFAVAAHLEPEILVVDEVLAVGDAEFQRKCLGKMKDVSEKNGRTILFVSHNMSAMRALCNFGITLENGRIVHTGLINESIRYYQRNHKNLTHSLRESTGILSLDTESIKVVEHNEKEENLTIPLEFNMNRPLESGIFIDVALKNNDDKRVLHCRMEVARTEISIINGQYLKVIYQVRQPHLIPGDYTLEVYVYDSYKHIHLWVDNIPFLSVSETNYFGITPTYGHILAPIIPPFSVEVESN